MKPAPFVYHRPKTVQEAVRLLGEVAAEDGRVLAGGQTLIPMMALRLAYPGHLIDINGVEGLDRVAVAGDAIEIGALVRHSRFETPVEPGPTGRLLAEVCRHIAHLPIRNRGTFCGSLANADGASEWCLTTATLGGVLLAASAAGAREVPASEFFLGVMTTALAPEEMLVGVRLPLLPSGSLAGFYEFSRRAGDFALAMSLSTFVIENGVIARPRVGVGGVEGAPRRIAEAEAMLVGRPATQQTFEEAARAAASAVEPQDEDADYRRDLTYTAVKRALERAAAPRDSFLQ